MCYASFSGIGVLCGFYVGVRDCKWKLTLADIIVILVNNFSLCSFSPTHNSCSVNQVENDTTVKKLTEVNI